MNLPQLPSGLSKPFAVAGTTYGELYALAAVVGRELEPFGDGPICLATQNRVLSAAAVLASLAGGPKLVLPHALSGLVLEQAQAATGFRAVLGDEAEVLPAGVERIQVSAHGGSLGAPALTRSSFEPFLALFTGGSTGRPTVWTKTAGNLLGEAAELQARFGIQPADLFLSCVPCLHIYGMLFSVLLPLISGAQVIERTAFLPAEITSALADQQTSVFISGPAHYRALRASSLAAPTLRLALSSGGMLDEEDGARFFEQTRIGVTEVYGSTETGGIAVRRRSAGEPDFTPLRGVRWALHGDRLAVDSAFLSPGLSRAADGLFVTGDRVEPTAAGRFALLGRADGIVKVAGKRVDLLEVEQRLLAMAGVRDAYVLAQDSPGRMTEIVALVVADRAEPALRVELAASLEPQSLPRRLIRVERIPTSPAGKRDRQAIDALLIADD